MPADDMAGLSWAARDVSAYMLRPPTIPVRHLHFFADNTSAISAIFEVKTAPAQGYSRVFRDLIVAFLDADPRHTVNVEWATGHHDIAGNELTDRLAKEATEIAAPHHLASWAGALREAREHAHQAWVREWTLLGPTGRFATANCLPPQDHPRKHFHLLKCEVFGRVTQCRTGHCFTGEYYRYFVPAEPDDCPCGHHRQTRAHVLQDCPRYVLHRHVLRDISETIDLPTILGTAEGIAALAVFIARSGAFTKMGAPRPACTGPRSGAPERAPAVDDVPGDVAAVLGEVASSDADDAEDDTP